MLLHDALDFRRLIAEPVHESRYHFDLKHSVFLAVRAEAIFTCVIAVFAMDEL
jgi:hypothetical protein